MLIWSMLVSRFYFIKTSFSIRSLDFMLALQILELSCGGKTKWVTKEELSLFGVPLDMPDDDEATKVLTQKLMAGAAAQQRSQMAL